MVFTSGGIATVFTVNTTMRLSPYTWFEQVRPQNRILPYTPVYSPYTFRIHSRVPPYTFRIPPVYSVYISYTPRILRIHYVYHPYTPRIPRILPYTPVYFRILSVYFCILSHAFKIFWIQNFRSYWIQNFKSSGMMQFSNLLGFKF